MLLFPLTFAFAIAIGWLRGGSFRSLASLRLRWPGLLLAALVLQLGIDAVGSNATLRFLTLACSYALVGACLALNMPGGPRWRRVGVAAMVAGYLLNVVAILANRSMPVSVAALRAVGGTPAALLEPPNLDKHVAAGSDAVWLWLGDVVPIPGVGAVISIGDIALIVGVVLVVCAGMMTVAPSVLGPEGR